MAHGSPFLTDSSSIIVNGSKGLRQETRRRKRERERERQQEEDRRGKGQKKATDNPPHECVCATHQCHANIHARTSRAADCNIHDARRTAYNVTTRLPKKNGTNPKQKIGEEEPFFCNRRDAHSRSYLVALRFPQANRGYAC